MLDLSFRVRLMRTTIYILVLCLAVTPLAAVSEPAADELEYNRRKLEQWRQNPEQLARLRANAQAFLALAPDRRKSILQLDHDLHEESSAVQARLNNVWDRYLAWLDQLRKDPQRQDDYQSIVEAPSKEARLAAIRDVRESEWLAEIGRASCRERVYVLV